MSDNSRYADVPKVYEEDFGFMPLPFCPEFENTFTHVVMSTDTINGLSYKYYGDTKYNWAIIVANEFPFPPKLEAGKTIIIPDPEEVINY